ncbi:SSI family serine proteinase inhibitor [Micromonospora citrea]|uniref:SSI family serine proteinase inhibitor n=1 Tax=Micromonospora citrea TaxID=47855 RepID=UPI003C4015E7
MSLARRAAAVVTAAILAVAAAMLLPRPAEAAPRVGPHTPSVLVLQTERQDEQRTALLLCGPTGGTHPDAATACRTVARVDGDLAALEFDEGPCTYEYAPVTVHAWGYWQDRPVNWSETYGNRCLMLRGTGALFDF